MAIWSLASEPNIVTPANVAEHAIEHSDAARARADPVMKTDHHHASSGSRFLVELVELFLHQELELRQVVSVQKVVQIIQMGGVWDGCNFASTQRDDERLIAA